MDKSSRRVRDRLHEIWVDTREDRMQQGRTTRSKCHTLSLATKLAMAEPKYTPVQLEMNVSRRGWEIGDHWVSAILCMSQYTWKARRPEL